MSANGYHRIGTRPCTGTRYRDDVSWFPQQEDSWPMTADLGKRDQSANDREQQQTHVASCSQHALAAVRLSLATEVPGTHLRTAILR
jgi:hypothetical protein